jgi:YidC/Oxa1 family membrane protein insertase
MQGAQRVMMLVLPVAFVPFVIRFPVGLVLYWVTTNLWTVGQGLITRRLMPKPVAPPKRTSRTPSKEERTPAPADGAKAAQPVPKPAAAVAGPPRRVKRKKKRARR